MKKSWGKSSNVHARACARTHKHTHTHPHARAPTHIQTHSLLIFITFKDMSLQMNRQIPANLPILYYIMLNEMGRNFKGRIKCKLSNKTPSGQTVSTSTCSSLKADTKNQYTIDPGMWHHTVQRYKRNLPHLSWLQSREAPPECWHWLSWSLSS